MAACLGLLFVCAAALAQGRPAADAATQARFDILEFVVSGNTVLATPEIERSVYPFMGPGRTVEDVQSARAALESLYRERGYATVGVDIPEQRVADGVIRLDVTEGRVSRTRVTGSRYYSQGYILAKVAGAAEGTVPHLPTLQAQLGAVNRTADRRVSPLLRPGKVGSTTEIDLVVEDRLPLHGSVDLNNRASANTSQTRLVAGLRHDNLLQRDHSAAVQVQVSPEKTDQVRVLSASYNVPLGLAGQDSMLFSYTRSDSVVAAGVGDTTVFGRGSIWSLRRNITTELADRTYRLLTLSADYKDFDETIEAGNTGFSTPIRYLPLGLGYLALLDDDTGRWQFGGGFGLGIRGLVNRQEQFADKRFGADGNYLIVKFDTLREHKLGAGFVGTARVEGQITADPLISNEQFVVGGVDSVRGYLESAAVGDNGVRVSLQLSTPELTGGSWPGIGRLSTHAFVDAAATELRQPLPGQRSRFRLLGAGVGARLKGKSLGSLAFDLGWALEPLGATLRRDVRAHATGSIEF